MSRLVKCPNCSKQVSFTPENQFRPFCSERCKLIDLGQWAEESYRIPVKAAADMANDGELDPEIQAALDDEFDDEKH